MRLPPDLLNLERQGHHHDLPERRKDLRQRANPVGRFTLRRDMPHPCAHVSHA
ncbi:hypothetical protein [Paraburkholderia strydomiana]|uniref:hypothetical protein n=1 Tax=Paraburkholderia strydomiana TaxID=1245417 RepID=UPI0038BB1CE7